MKQKIQRTKELLSKYDCFIFDMDGVLWQGGQKLDHSMEFLKHLQMNQKQMIFLTNNSTRTRSFYQERLAGYGVSVDVDSIFGSSYLTAYYLKQQNIDKVFMVGEPGMQEELRNQSIQAISECPENILDHMNDLTLDGQIKAVVVGMDYQMNYSKIALASLYLQQNQALFLSTNPDKNVRHGKYKIPAGGATVFFLSQVAAVEAASELPSLCIGKPNPFAFSLFQSQYKLDKTKCLMIGDNLNTDIKFAHNSGIDSLLLLTGVTSESFYLQQPIEATYYADNLKYE